MLVAITGRSGSGKSEVSRYYTGLGYTVLDCDIIAHEVLVLDNNVKARLTAAFGADILGEDKAISPRRLASVAFANETNTRSLTDITHPAIINSILRSVSEHDGIVFVDGAVIIGELLEQYCDKIIVITSSHEQCVARIISRDDITISAAENRLRVQKPDETLLAKADFVIQNNGNKEQLITQAQNVLAQISKMVNGKT